MTFQLAPDVILPANAPTQTFAYLGTRGSGKSYGAGVQVEEFLRGQVQVVIVDPVGIWWALRYAADGKAPGFEIPVFGGWHGDVPLEPTGGELVAQLVAERRMSVVLDVSEFSYGQQRRFVADFATLLFALKKRNKSPIHLVFEEGHEFFPQMVEGAAAEMAGATKRLWKIGRNFGIGGTIISQRAAEVNKGALNLTDVVITGQLKAPNDVKTIAAWCNDNGTDDAAIKQLSKQPKGVLTVWGARGAVTTTFRKKTTLDASRTPEAGDFDLQAQALPPIDLADVRTAMAATIQEAKANDPKALRAEIERLRAELNAPAEDPAPILVERDRWRGEFRRVDGELHDLHTALGGATGAEVRRLRAMETRFEQVIVAVDGYRADAAPPPPRNAPKPPVQTQPAPERVPSGSDGDGAARMLRALASFHPRPLTKSQLGTLAIMKPTGGSFARYMSRLRSEHMISTDGGLVSLTAAGLKAAGPVSKPESPRALLALWKGKLTGKARDMLDVLSAEGAPLTKASLAERVEMDVGGGSFARYMSTLRSNGLMVKTSGGFRAVESLVVR